MASSSSSVVYAICIVWKVKRRLDLEKTETAWRYMDRYGSDVIKRNILKIDQNMP